jgi:methionine-rich copper-binding protein CopC
MAELKSRKRAWSTITVVLLFALLFLFLVTPAVLATMYGDINEDGEIDVRDVVLIQRHVLGKITLTAQQKVLANVKGFGEIDARDVVLIMQRSLGLIDEFPHTALMVDKVAAVNAKQVEVHFNRIIGPEELAKMTAANFHVGLQASPTVNRLTGIGAAVAVQEDGKTVLLTMGDTFIFVNGSSTNRVVVKKEVGLAADFVDASVPYIDTTIPSLVSVHTESPRDIILTFSEPLDNTVTPTNITLNGGTVFLNLPAATYVDARRELRIQSFTDLTVGSHTLVIASGTSLKDYSGFPVTPISKTFTHAPVSTPPTVQAISSTETSVTLQFSRAINTATFKDNVRLIFRHTFDSTISQVDGTVVTNPSGDNRTFIIDFGGKILPPGSTNVWMKYLDGTTDAQKAKDTWGNIIAPASFTVNTVPDTTPPTATVTLVSGSDNKKLLVEYSKTVTGGAVAANYSLRRGITPVAILSVQELIGGEGRRFEITVGNSMYGEHSLTISNIKDITPAQNAMGTQTYTINIPDTVKPVVVNDVGTAPSTHYYVQALAGDSTDVRIYFSKQMNPIDLANITFYEHNSTNPILATPAADGRSVFLRFAANVTGNLTVGPLRDLAGNSLGLATILTKTQANPVQLDDIVTATTTTTIVVRLTDFVTNVSVNDFEIRKNNLPGTLFKKPAAVQLSVVNGKTIVTLTLSSADALAPDADGAVIRTIDGLGNPGATANAKNLFDIPVQFGESVINDRIPPTLISAVVDSPNQITLTFSEDLKPASLALAGTNGFSVPGSTLTSAIIGATDDKVVITRASGNLFVAGSTTVSYTPGQVTDINNNALAAISNRATTN